MAAVKPSSSPNSSRMVSGQLRGSFLAAGIRWLCFNTRAQLAPPRSSVPTNPGKWVMPTPRMSAMGTSIRQETACVSHSVQLLWHIIDLRSIFPKLAYACSHTLALRFQELEQTGDGDPHPLRSC